MVAQDWTQVPGVDCGSTFEQAEVQLDAELDFVTTGRGVEGTCMFYGANRVAYLHQIKGKRENEKPGARTHAILTNHLN